MLTVRKIESKLSPQYSPNQDIVNPVSGSGPAQKIAKYQIDGKNAAAVNDRGGCVSVAWIEVASSFP